MNRLGLLLDDQSAPCFSHGQLYTAISRTGDPTAGLAILLPPDRSSNETNNVVFQRIVRIMTVAGPSNSDHVHADVEDNDRVLSCPLIDDDDMH